MFIYTTGVINSCLLIACQSLIEIAFFIVFFCPGKKTRIKPSRKAERRKVRAEKKARKVAFFTRKKEQVSKLVKK